MIRLFAAAAAALLLAGCATVPGVPEAPARAVYRGATLIDGTGAAPRAGMSLVTAGERIVAVVPDAELPPESLAGAQVHDLGGRFVIPGLIDAHQHLATPPNLPRSRALMRRDLYGGITAVRVMADDLRPVAELAREARAGTLPGPDVSFAALVAGRSFFDDPRTRAASGEYRPGEAPWMQAIDDRTDIPLAVARARGTGATGLKIYANLEPHLVRALTAEGRRQGLGVWAHGMVFPTLPADVIAAGPHVVSHTCYLAYQISDPAPSTYQERFPVEAAALAGGDHPAMAALFREMKRQGIVLDATLRVYGEAERRQAARGGPPYHCSLELAATLTAQAHREGVDIAAGTDGATARTDPWPALHEELELLVARAGLTPLEALRSATSVGARTIGLEEEMGSIAPGKLANFVVLARDPSRDIGAVRSVVTTVKRGRVYPRAGFRPITAAELPD
ncbi:MAG: amidohydrolase family protein [Allosphingosinicella sp.]|uniref:amidohydrolase family protein n=1 Tax=Allosphingosinicella sp. TaxID=2823234 RepID=UPI0039477B12